MKAAVHYKSGAPDVFKYTVRPDPALRPVPADLACCEVGIPGAVLTVPECAHTLIE